jgi:hypothetical protein
VKRLLWFGLVALFGWGVVWTSGRADEAVGGRHHVQKEALYLWSGGQVQRAFPGLQMLMADVYWLRTVQYYGWEHRYAPDPHYELLEPLIDITVTMDPRLELAYWYGAIFLCETAPQGAGKIDAGLALLERGCRNNPKSWKLRQELAFTRFLFRHDADGAVDALQEAMKIPGSPVWLRNLIGHFLGAGGARDRARALWQDMYRNESGSMKENARVHLLFLDVLDQRDEIRTAVDQFNKTRGRRPTSLQEVMSAGLLRRPPVDSTGVPFAYDPSTGRVTVSKDSRLYRAEDQ